MIPMIKGGIFVSVLILLISEGAFSSNIKVNVSSIDLRFAKTPDSYRTFAIKPVLCKERFLIKPITGLTDFIKAHGIRSIAYPRNPFDTDPNCLSAYARTSAVYTHDWFFVSAPGVNNLFNRDLYSFPPDKKRPEVLLLWLQVPLPGVSVLHQLYYSLFHQGIVVGAEWVDSSTVQVKSFSNPNETLTANFLSIQ